MAIRNIVKEGDPILNKVCRPVTNFDDRLATLLDDMHETMIAAIRPVNKGETVFCLEIDTLLRIGALALTGKTDGTPIAINTPTLTVPHPHLTDRPFFLTPYRQLKSK